MSQLTRELIDNGRLGQLSALGEAIEHEICQRNITFREVVFEYSALGLNYTLAKSAHIEFKIDQEIADYHCNNVCIAECLC